jgi:hypothetical protein
MTFIAGVSAGAILATSVAAWAQWNQRSGGGNRPDTDLLERMVRAQEDIARHLGQGERGRSEIARALQDGARSQGEMARSLGELKSRCR